MNRVTRFARLVSIGVATTIAGCGGYSVVTTPKTNLETSALTCSQLAEQYKGLIESDASRCTLGDDATCTGRRPIWGSEMAGETVVSYMISECPVAGSGIPVNPSRLEALDVVLSAYKAKGCDTSAAPGCGASGSTPRVATCQVVQSGAPTCH